MDSATTEIKTKADTILVLRATCYSVLRLPLGRRATGGAADRNHFSTGWEGFLGKAKRGRESHFFSAVPAPKVAQRGLGLVFSGAMNRYTLTKKLGDGTYGSVVKAVNRQTGEEVAVKKMKKLFTRCVF